MQIRIELSLFGKELSWNFNQLFVYFVGILFFEVIIQIYSNTLLQNSNVSVNVPFVLLLNSKETFFLLCGKLMVYPFVFPYLSKHLQLRYFFLQELSDRLSVRFKREEEMNLKLTINFNLFLIVFGLSSLVIFYLCSNSFFP